MFEQLVFLNENRDFVCTNSNKGSFSIISNANSIEYIDFIYLFCLNSQYAAAMTSNVGAGLFSISQYPLNLAALAAAHNKNSSIADLRLKAKKHAEALGLKENTS